MCLNFVSVILILKNKKRKNISLFITPFTVSAEVEQIFHEASPDIEVNVRMININHRHNKKLLSTCRLLEEYAWFVEQARKNLSADKNGEPSVTGDAIDKAIDEMPED